MAAEQRATGTVPAVAPPGGPAVPDWSDETLAAFADLSPLERTFVEFYATGGNAAEAYRRASGAEYTDRETDSTRNNGYAIRSRPRVQRAIDAAMKDMNFDARLDRAWMLQRLQVALDKAEASDKPQSHKAAAEIVKIIAELKGEITHKSEQTVTVLSEETPAMKRFMAAVQRARERAGITPVITQAVEG